MSILDRLKNDTYKYESRVRIAIFVIQTVIIIYFLLSMTGKTFLGPTLDDSWIHYQYVRNIALYGEISFNVGEWTTGTTSLLWDFMMVPGALVGIPIMPMSILLGIILYYILGQQIYSILKTYWKSQFNCILSLGVILMTGNMTWFALSGMETILFLVLGLWWIAAFHREKWWLAGLITGLMMLTRIEGTLMLPLGIVLVLRKYGVSVRAIKSSIVQFAYSIPLMIPSFILNKVVTGKFYPATMSGKKWLYGFEPGLLGFSLRGIREYIMVWIATFFQANWWPELVDRPSTIQYPIMRFLTGGRIDKHPPDFPLDPYPIWFQALAVLIGVIFLLILLRGFYRVIRPALVSFFTQRKWDKWELLFFWFLGHNLLYLVLMPHRGQGGRYQAINFILAGLFMIAGTDACVKSAGWLAKTLKRGFRPLIIAFYIASIITWGDIYASSVMHVNKVHRAAGEWMRDHIPSGTVVAVFDVGAIKYFSQLPIVDIAGLTDHQVLEYILNDKTIDILRQRKAEYLAMVNDIDMNRNNPTLYSSFYYDKLGLRKEIGKSINLIPICRFAIPPEAWFRHGVVLRTHDPVIMIYRIDWMIQSDKSANQHPGWKDD